jgi:SAM-dependent methyltransferase
MTALDWGAAAVARAPGFREAQRVVELGAGDFSRSLALAERYPEKHFLSTDYELGEPGRRDGTPAAAPANLEIAALDARSIDVPAGSVDFLFSIALMEHVAELAQCLESASRALRPGGVYFYIQAPFWTCAQGHHYRHGDDRTYDFIPKYAHLTHDRDELLDVLLAGPRPPFDPYDCVDAIYKRPDLSRIGLHATRAIVERGPLRLLSWTQTPDRRYDESLARAAFPRLREPATFDELAVSGASVVLGKASGRIRRRAVADRVDALRRRVGSRRRR